MRVRDTHNKGNSIIWSRIPTISTTFYDATPTIVIQNLSRSANYSGQQDGRKAHLYPTVGHNTLLG